MAVNSDTAAQDGTCESGGGEGQHRFKHTPLSFTLSLLLGLSLVTMQQVTLSAAEFYFGFQEKKKSSSSSFDKTYLS